MIATVVLCDIRNSRKIKDRERFREQLRNCLYTLNRDEDALVSRFAVQAGIDEFAGIVATAECGKVISRLWFGLCPYAVRCSVVTGILDIRGDTDQVDQLPAVYEFDGPAFHLAADQLEMMQHKEQLFCYRNKDLAEWESDLISALGDQLYAQMLDWTQRQREVVWRYAMDGTQATVADSLGVSQSVISRSLAALDYKRFDRALGKWQACFAKLPDTMS